MKAFLYFAGLFLIPAWGFAQIVTVDYILRKEIHQESSNFIDSNNLTFYQTGLAFEFEDDKLGDSDIYKLLKSKTIYKVELYYSSYKLAPDFSQQELNRRRLVSLRKKLPSVFENNAIEWKLIEQVENDETKAKKLFHGFIFYSREPYVVTKSGKKTLTAKEEIEIIKNYLGDPLPLEYKSVIDFSFDVSCDTTYLSTPTGRIKKTRKYTGMFVPKSTRKKEKGILYKKKSIWNRPREFTVDEHPIVKTETIINCTEKFFSEPYPRIIRSVDDVTRNSLTSDTVVLTTLTKKKWQKALIVEDVTGSMYPYLAQTFKWRRLRIAAKLNNNFAFFNDGDDKPDGPIGESGGVYNIMSDSIDVVEATAYSTMQKGNGGGAPENNVEAMVKGVKNSKTKFQSIILVADNYAPVRDMSNLDDVIRMQLPVHVIVCGGYTKAVNYQYIDIARKTGGAIHTLSEEIDFSAKLAEGATIMVGGQSFEIVKGELVLK